MISFEHFRMEEGVPIYPQIIGYIERGVVAGAIRSGDEMPSRRTLSALLGVNPNTVQKAYRMLEEEGLITSHTGAKSYVSADAGLVERIRGELVEETVRGAAAALRQMGVDRDEAAALLRRLWDAGKKGEEAR
ncbi:GntR family transcriptional regulator [Lawsonibacter celer]|jgi:GntR family transcriptional regulator|uniref:GntR family transcriptional regulator n=1 Tax=Lawsonibacter celer TaxID=2986526 RepID=UPI001645F742|nr:GntR family transcriptional regulator [Lawsonibacter celer]